MRTKPLEQIDVRGGDFASNTPCIRCGRAVKTRQWTIHVIHGGADILHPGDEGAYLYDAASDLGLQDLGPDCARAIGLEWCHSA